MKGKLLSAIPAKVSAFILFLLAGSIFVISAVGAAALWYCESNYGSIENAKQSTFSDVCYREARQILSGVLNNHARSTDNATSAKFLVEDSSGSTIYVSDGLVRSGSEIYELDYYISYSDGGYFTDFYEDSLPDEYDYLVRVFVGPDFPLHDNLYMFNQMISLLYSLGWRMYAICAAAVLLMIVCFVFLMCSAGHRAGHDEIVCTGLMRVPFDIYTFCAGALVIGCIGLAMEIIGSDTVLPALIPAALLIAAGIAILLGFCINLAARVKLGKFWCNTVIYRVLRFIKHTWLAIWNFARRAACGLPLVWKTALAAAGISLLELIVIVLCIEESGFIFLWFVEKLLLAAAAIYLALTLRELHAGGKALAAGNTSYHVDTSHMILEFKEHGEDLNNLAAGVSRAVDEKMKSERFKTELITNVSHDIKTPLTSIINYSDLICKEECGSEKIHEYSQVLLRQSVRLKKLLEDLLEASKASTGNLDVQLSRCDAGVLLSQAAGEYESRLAQGSLELIIKQPEEPLYIMADGRRISRVFDNLMNNICKYAQEGTRVYLTLDRQDSKAVISFKNISKYPLDISADELMERFVRGDRSRSTEGSGLGLSIARNLTELQGGELRLVVDGDLFKALLIFDAV